MAVKIEKWVVAQKKHRLSDKHIQMARELGLNPDKLGKIDNHKQETWKAPLPQFIEEMYFKRFKREEPVVVRSLKDFISDDKARKEKKKKEKAQKRALEKQDNIDDWDDKRKLDWEHFVSICEEYWSDSPDQIDLLSLVEGNKDIAVVINYRLNDSAKDWMYREVPALGNRKPIDFLKSNKLKTKLREVLWSMP